MTTASSTPRGVRGQVTSVVSAVREVAGSLLSRPLASYHLVLALAGLLTLLGLVMILSASSVEGYSKEGSAYGLFTTQLVFALMGVVVFYVTLWMPVRMFRRLAAVMITVTTILLVLVLIPGIGIESGGARRWFVVAGLSVQPSELVKVALCVWGAHVLAARRKENAGLKELLIPLLPMALLICVLIMLEPNLSTTITIAIIVGALLWFSGLPLVVFGSFAVIGAGLAVMLSLVAGYRSQRVLNFLGHIDDPQGAGYQSRQASYALANGGVFGEGLGQSRAKWNYLPNAHNDFIFAIIGEELGLLGGLMVVGLFGLLAYVGFRIASRSVDPFLRLLTSTITVLIVAQAFINIGYVIGVLPVTGIQLPLVSAGGTSALTVLAMLGLMANAARHEPDAVAALSVGRRSGAGRWLRLPAPVPYRAARVPTERGKSPRPQERRRDQGQVPSAPANRPSALRVGWPTGRGGTPRSAERTTSTRGGGYRGAGVRRTRGNTGRGNVGTGTSGADGWERTARLRIDYRTGYSANRRTDPAPRTQGRSRRGGSGGGGRYSA
ncbi:putative lipid II flippase FtsW [Gordonia amarae]|uniref:Probable peptidoglycan glycosyltransferase FtsW n=2 Tax=Gordonia amarae TaxID=36821 RepID=G7GPM0_9ACTN|nr:putative lipid II flippase FtsW [Gordonia amarae]MCS3879563.1 cell division protein FtsW [Gordonia amarae]QHN18024.1 putative lipid II flippase FtsW [Gordonia amarae]QHN22544.1 putative lipid II flippase FtsW [Gordonia amarae]QHN31410.1 putative lipid II flippase FtsW [Gordonia amarae]QHN40155.1 putative lipid II flippase FtsW [Gordonia amarae]